MLNLFKELKKDAEKNDDTTVSILSFTICLICVFMFIVNLATRSAALSAITGVMSFWLIINCLMYRRWKNFAVLSINTLTAIGLMMMYFVVTGGKDGFSIVWLLLVPPIGIFFYKLLFGGGFSILLGIFTAIYMWSPLHELGYAYSETYLLRFPIIYFFDTIVCIYINYTLLTVRKKQDELIVIAQQASSTKSDFLANMSHEIRTPL
ncbi:MAG: hypothetical protein ACI4K7_00715, partial [Oscillospiraceae bacterium]